MLVGGLEHAFFPIQLEIFIIPTDEVIFFQRGSFFLQFPPPQTYQLGVGSSQPPPAATPQRGYLCGAPGPWTTALSLRPENHQLPSILIPDLQALSYIPVVLHKAVAEVSE